MCLTDSISFGTSETLAPELGTQIASKLGITDPKFLKGDLIRIDIKPEVLKNLSLRSAAGTEVGANSLFVPGGRTSGNVTEAVVNGIPKNAPGVSSNVVKP